LYLFFYDNFYDDFFQLACPFYKKYILIYLYSFKKYALWILFSFSLQNPERMSTENFGTRKARRKPSPGALFWLF